VEESRRILQSAKENLQSAQNQQKIYADRHRVEHSFEVGRLGFPAVTAIPTVLLQEERSREIEA
jgi:hypothetical protein